MEVLHRYGTRAQKEKWLRPLMNGEIRSAFLMTEPAVASSDATNIETEIKRDGDHYVINGRKWWSSGVGDPRCKIAIVMGKTDKNAERHRQQSQILVPLDKPGVKVVRMLPVFGFDDAPHGHAEVILDNVRVPADNLLLGEGRGFEIAQGRLGPGRIHHCMRTIGVAEAALEKMVKRLQSRVAFGKRISEQSVWEQRIGEARTNIEMTRLLCLKAADMPCAPCSPAPAKLLIPVVERLISAKKPVNDKMAGVKTRTLKIDSRGSARATGSDFRALAERSITSRTSGTATMKPRQPIAATANRKPSIVASKSTKAGAMAEPK